MINMIRTIMIKNYNSDDNEKRQNRGKDSDKMEAKMLI